MNKLKKFFMKESVTGYVFSLPFIIGMVGFTLIPMGISFYYSFTNYTMNPGEKWVGFDNYIKLFHDERFINSVFVTLRYVIWSVPLKLAFSLLVAYVLTNKKLKGDTLYRSLYYIPSLIGGSVAVALVWKQLFATQGGLINTILSPILPNGINWFGDMKLALWPLILVSVWQFGSSMIIFAAGLKEIPETLYEAAEIDGANSFTRFFKITLPLLSPIILFNLIMQTINAFMAFTQAFVITQGGPADATNVYSLYLYNQAFSYRNMGYASAMGWLMLVVISVITLIIFKTSKVWVYEQGSEN